jgi:signal transduction histidine kinase
MALATKPEFAPQRPVSRPPVRTPSLIIGVLLVIGIGILAFHTESGVDNSRKWIVHTYDVRTDLQNLQMAIAQARATRSAYLLSADSDQRTQMQQQLQTIHQLIQRLRISMADNPRQQARMNTLEPLLTELISEMGNTSVSPVAHNAIPPGGASSTRQLISRQSQIDAIIRDMSEEEQMLLEGRLTEWNQLYRRNLIVMALAFGAAVLLLIFNFQMLLAEVGRTKEMEKLARDNTESYRALSARILELQDTERRRVARDLHDSVGQYLAGLKINLSRIESGRGGSAATNAQLFSETLELVDHAIAEVRTISHLLHPPLLDELGFDSAARWYVDEFAKRSGVKVTMTIGEIVNRLPRSIELALFRILQESLTNVHRHADASSVAIDVTCHGDKVFLTVRDSGKGIRPEVLQRFRAGMAAGVGLAGMKERVAELDGELRVESSSQGTAIRATLPTNACESPEVEDCQQNKKGRSTIGSAL